MESMADSGLSRRHSDISVRTDMAERDINGITMHPQRRERRNSDGGIITNIVRRMSNIAIRAPTAAESLELNIDAAKDHRQSDDQAVKNDLDRANPYHRRHIVQKSLMLEISPDGVALMKYLNIRELYDELIDHISSIEKFNESENEIIYDL